MIGCSIDDNEEGYFLVSILLQTLIVIYLFGVAFTFIFMTKNFIAVTWLKESDEFTSFKWLSKIQSYLIRKILFWPFYLAVEQSPISLISELFFSRYGNKDHIYFGDRGIKNFLSDLLKGKNRYKRYQIKVYWVKLNEQSKAYQNYIQYDKNKHQVIYAKVFLAKPPKPGSRYLFMVHTMPESCYDPNENEQSVTRFDLDQCYRVNNAELEEHLSEISPRLTKSIME